MGDLVSADLVVHGGLVVAASGSRGATVVVDGGRIVGLLDPDVGLPPHERAIDAQGKLVIPGGVDPHCHIGQRLGDYQALDDYERASVAALHGGTTTLVDFAIPMEGRSPLEEVRSRRSAARASRCDTALHGCVIEWDETTASQLATMMDEGVRTVKLFTTYRNEVMANPDTVLRVMRELGPAGGMAYVHAEANHLVEDAQYQAAQAGHRSASDLPATRPELAEAAAVAEVLAIAEHVGGAVYFVHLTTPEALDAVHAAHMRGVDVHAETCPHYLALDESQYAGSYPERYACCPPLRSGATVAALRSRVLRGQVDALGSDHCCFSAAQKALRADDVTAMPNGLPGVETRLPVAFTELVVNNGMSVDRFVALFATNAARLNGLPGKGVIAVGSDADLVVLDPRDRRTVSAAELHMATDYSPYEGRELSGWPSTVVSGGRVVLDGDGFHDPGPAGRPLRSLPVMCS